MNKIIDSLISQAARLGVEMGSVASTGSRHRIAGILNGDTDKSSLTYFNLIQEADNVYSISSGDCTVVDIREAVVASVGAALMSSMVRLRESMHQREKLSTNCTEPRWAIFCTSGVDSPDHPVCIVAGKWVTYFTEQGAKEDMVGRLKERVDMWRHGTLKEMGEITDSHMIIQVLVSLDDTLIKFEEEIYSVAEYE